MRKAVIDHKLKAFASQVFDKGAISVEIDAWKRYNHPELTAFVPKVRDDRG